MQLQKHVYVLLMEFGGSLVTHRVVGDEINHIVRCRLIIIFIDLLNKKKVYYAE